MRSLADVGLGSFHAAGAREFAAVAERAGVVERELCIAERRIAIRIAGRELAGALTAALAHHPRPDGGEAVDATISAWEARSCPDGPVPFPWRQEDIGPGGLVHGSDPDGVTAVHETGSGALTVARERSLLHRVPRLDAVPWWERAAPLRVALFWALRGEHLHLVHAGAVGDDRGGVLLAGARNSGKTTVALAAVTHGLQYVADDSILLDTRRQPTAHGLYKTASVREHPGALDKSVMDVERVMPGAVRGSLPVRAVIAPRIGSASTRLAPLSPTRALLALAPSTVFQMPFDDGAALRSLAALARRVPCYSLDVGDDPADLANAIDHVLDRA